MENKKENKKNTSSLREMIGNTKENIADAEISLEFADPEVRENLHEKIAHRKYAVQQMKEQLKEDQKAIARKNGDA